MSENTRGKGRIRRAPVGGGERRRRTARGVDDIVSLLKSNAELSDRVTHWEEIAPREARSVDFPERLSVELRAVYEERGIARPYEHQARAIEWALDGRDVLVATPTASGKTVCYTAPVLQSLIETDGAARSLFLFPTKALSQDQTAGLTGLVEELGRDWHAYTYDGDTPTPVRRTLRDRGHMILTNPWMLHAGILPNHAKWSELFRDLRYIVVDEVHTLSGVFGSSVANVLRRLVRIARHYGSDPRFLGSSATLPDAAGHGQRLFGRPVSVVDQDGSPAGRRIFGVYNPPVLNPVAGLRANALEEARKLSHTVCGPNHQTILFCRRRTAVEVLTRYLKESAADLGLTANEIRGYRGGYLPNLRREIEDGLRNGEVKVVVTTNALELGIDVGMLDVCVLVGYPGSQASFWQRAGRVGRRGNESLCLMIARSEPVDQYLARHPQRLFGLPKERLSLDPDNLVILSEQLKCAAFELPFKQSEADPEHVDDETFGTAAEAPAILDYLAEESRLLHKRGPVWYWMSDAYPAQDVTLGGADPDNVLIVDSETEKAVGECDREASITTVHEGAIYIVEGETMVVERFDHANRRAYVKPVEVDYFTDAQSDSAVRVLLLEEHRTRRRLRPADEHGNASDELIEDASIWRGEIHVTTVATQYKKIRFYTRENVGCGEIHLPPEELDTEAFVLTISEETACDLGLHAGDRSAAWRGVGNLLRRVAPLFVRCQPRDLGLSSQVKAPHFDRPALFLYDRVQGGVGLAEVLFSMHREVLQAAHEIVAHCACENGCPACVGPIEEVGPLGKPVARTILEYLLEGASLDRVALDAEEREDE